MPVVVQHAEEKLKGCDDKALNAFEGRIDRVAKTIHFSYRNALWVVGHRSWISDLDNSVWLSELSIGVKPIIRSSYLNR